MKWICWECGHDNHYKVVKPVQNRCEKCGAQLQISKAPLASSSNIAGFLLLFGGVFWGYDNLVDQYVSFTTYGILAVLFAVVVGFAMVWLGLALYNRAAKDHQEGERL